MCIIHVLVLCANDGIVLLQSTNGKSNFAFSPPEGHDGHQVYWKMLLKKAANAKLCSCIYTCATVNVLESLNVQDSIPNVGFLVSNSSIHLSNLQLVI